MASRASGLTARETVQKWRAELQSGNTTHGELIGTLDRAMTRARLMAAALAILPFKKQEYDFLTILLDHHATLISGLAHTLWTVTEEKP